MPKWIETPLRPHGQPWPGLNTKGGRLDPGSGFLEDGSFNGIINEADILAKRSGLIRGLDERFDGVVCGLFKYTDDCGVEYLVVADQESIKVRMPFDIPTFLGSDSLPFDDFNSLSTTDWTNTTDYETFAGALQLTGSAVNIIDDSVPATRLMQWFKPAAITSYFVEIQYALVVGGSDQVVSVAIKRSDDTFLEASVYLTASSYTTTMDLVQAGSRSRLDTVELGGATLGNGFLRLSYNAETRVATARVIPSGGSQESLSAALSEAQDNNLGQDSAIGIARSAEENGQAQIEQVFSGAV